MGISCLEAPAAAPVAPAVAPPVAPLAGSAGGSTAPRDGLLERICRCPSAPALPAVVIDVLRASGGEADLNRLAVVVSKDGPLVARVLRAVNAGRFALRHRVASVAQALPILGLRNLRAMTAGLGVFPAVKLCRAGAVDYAAWSRRSLYSAAAARLLAEKLEAAPPDDCFVSALLMDVGMPAAGEALGDAYAALVRRAERHADVVALEREALGLTHAHVAAALTRQWGLPEGLCQPIRFHHDPAAAPAGPPRRTAQVIRLAGVCADVFVEQNPLWAISECYRLADEDFGADRAKIESVLEELAGEARALGETFEVRIDPTATFAQARQRVSKEFVAGTAAGAAAESPAPAPASAAGRERRRESRSPRTGTITVIPCGGHGVGRPIRAGFQDVSPTGIGLRFAHPVAPGSQFIVGLRRGTEPKTQLTAILYAARRCDPLAPGEGYAVGAELLRAMREQDLNADPAGDSVLHRVGRILLAAPAAAAAGQAPA